VIFFAIFLTPLICKRFSYLQDIAGLNNTAVVERVLAEALEKRKVNYETPVCLVIDGKYHY